jgi:hypothetical protein
MNRTLQDSFIDVSDKVVKKAKALFKIKENTLIRAAEKAVYIGISRDDGFEDPVIKDFYAKLEQAFDKHYLVNFYLNSDYIFFFETGVLVNIHPVFPAWKSHVQKIWKTNKANWDNASAEDRVAFAHQQINAFNMDNDLTVEIDDDPHLKRVVMDVDIWHDY